MADRLYSGSGDRSGASLVSRKSPRGAGFVWLAGIVVAVSSVDQRRFPRVHRGPQVSGWLSSLGLVRSQEPVW